jgi:disulfide bond formation protein DsbB
MSRSPVYTALAAAVLFLVVVPLGTSVFVLGFVHGDSPCILCWAQRIGMAIVALIGLFILRYGPKPTYIGLGVLVAAYGTFMAIRHSSLHLSRDIGQGFAIELLGAHTYVWSFAVFWTCLVVMGVMLMAVPRADLQPGPARSLRPLDRIALGGFLVVTAGTIVQAFASTGPPPFVGQSDPVRFSFDPRDWVWSLDEYSAAPVSLRGRWAVPRPDVTAVDPDPSSLPFGSLPRMSLVERRGLRLPLNGTPTGLDYDAAADRFLLTTEHGIYLTDAALQTVGRHTVVDPLFSVDLGRFAAAVRFDDGRIAAITENKSYVVLRETARGDPRRNRRYFLESPESFDEVTRSRFATLRARLMHIMSAAWVPETRSIVTISVPNPRSRRWAVARFDAADMQLVEEYVPRLDPALVPSASEGAIESFFITGAASADGRLYAISAAGGVLLTIDLMSRAIVEARVVPGLDEPTGLAIRGRQFFIVSRDGTLSVVE